MLLALAPILTTLFASGSLASGLAAIGATQWIALGETILAATPQEISALSAVAPLFSALVNDVKSAGSAHVAPGSVGNWLSDWKERQPKTIEGYLPDGSVGEILNPDAA